MNSYKVTISEKLEMTVEIEAPDRYEAEQLVEEQWQNGEHILDAGHFKDVRFDAVPARKARRKER